MLGWIITVLALGFIAWPFLSYVREVRQRRRQVSQPFPAAWQELLAKSLPHYRRLSPDQHARLEACVQRFLSEKRFYGCNGLAVTEEMRVLIAGLACLLILRPNARVFPGLRSVLVYPTAFWVRHEEPDDLGLVSDEEVLELGESWSGTRVVLSWEDVQAALAGDAVNVVAHEFAHQLDDENPDSPGAPLLPSYERWSKVMKSAYAELCSKGSPVLDEYGTESPTEFFAVATEAYFQNGPQLQRHHPALYSLLSDYYRIKTAA